MYSARALRDVGGRIAVAQQRVDARVSGLGDDLAVAVGVEAVDHHAVVAGEVAHGAGRGVGQGHQVGRIAQAAHGLGQRALQRGGRQVHGHRVARGGHHRLELQHQQAGRGAVQHAFEAAAARGRRQWLRHGQVGRGLQRGHGAVQRATQGGQRAFQPVRGGMAQQFGGVVGDLQHGPVGLAQHQQQPVRLHRSGEVDQLTFAVGQVCLAEGRAVRHDRS